MDRNSKQMSILTVALTGGIATGKSLVAGIFRQRGFFVQSADQVAHDLMKPGRRAWKAILSHFGPSILEPDKTVNRTRLASIVFADTRERLFLNSIVHPLVMERNRRTIRRLEKKGLHRVFVSEAALTVEAGYSSSYDRVIVTDCPLKLQLRRLMERDGIGRRAALQRVRSQMPAIEKRRCADYLIDTSGSVEDTVRQAEDVCRRLRRDYWRKQKNESEARKVRSRTKGPRPKAGLKSRDGR
jgi:dephospho-CoA kinase